MNTSQHAIEAAIRLCKQLTSTTTPLNEQIGILTALADRGETAEELVGFAEYLNSKSVPIAVPGIEAMDVCGTGGSRLPRMNTSTVVAYIVASLGVPVAKHGNRAASGRSGSFDVLEVLGIPVEQSPYCIATTLKQLNCAFVFAPLYHPLLKNVSAARKAYGKRTIFNLVGPLINPVQPRYQLIGTTDRKTAHLLAQTLQLRGIKKAIVVCGDDGLDDITLCGGSTYFEVTPHGITEKRFEPEQHGFTRLTSFTALTGGTAADNAFMLRDLLKGKGRTELQHLITINAAFALLARGFSKNITEAIAAIHEVYKSEKAFTLLYDYKALAQKCWHPNL